MCNKPKIPEAKENRPVAPVEAVRALASPFEGLTAGGISKLRIPSGTPKSGANSPLAIPQ